MSAARWVRQASEWHIVASPLIVAVLQDASDTSIHTAGSLTECGRHIRLSPGEELRVLDILAPGAAACWRCCAVNSLSDCDGRAMITPTPDEAYELTGA